MKREITILLRFLALSLGVVVIAFKVHHDLPVWVTLIGGGLLYVYVITGADR